MGISLYYCYVCKETFNDSRLRWCCSECDRIICDQCFYERDEELFLKPEVLRWTCRGCRIKISMKIATRHHPSASNTFRTSFL